MSEDDETEANEDEEFKPQPRSEAQKRIANLMYNEGKSYSEAFDIVMGQKKPKTFDWYNEPTPTPQPKKQFSIENLEDLANSINSELENLETEKASFLEKKTKVAQHAEAVLEVARELDSSKLELKKAWEQQREREKMFNEYVIDYNAKVSDFNQQIQKLKEASEKEAQKTHAYVKKLSSSAEKEFGED